MDLHCKLVICGLHCKLPKGGLHCKVSMGGLCCKLAMGSLQCKLAMGGLQLVICRFMKDHLLRTQQLFFSIYVKAAKFSPGLRFNFQV